jgi:hypothetical protein
MAIAKDSWQGYLGLAAGFVIALLVIGGSIWLISEDHDWAGATLGGISLTGLVSVFVYGANARRSERRRNAEDD